MIQASYAVLRQLLSLVYFQFQSQALAVWLNLWSGIICHLSCYLQVNIYSKTCQVFRVLWKKKKNYHKFLKIRTPQNFGVVTKILTRWLCRRVMHLKDADGLANSGNSDQNAPLELAKTKSAVINFGCFLYFLFSVEPGHEKMCFMSYANNKGADQPAHRHSLISAFVVRCLDSIISLDSTAKISRL